MARQTFTEWLADNSYTIPAVSNITEDAQATLETETRELIGDWYSLRQIVPHFDVFFQRALNLAYPYYVQLLRVDPSRSSFDWLVDAYREAETQDSDSRTRTPDLTDTLTHGLKTVESGNPSTVRTGSVDHSKEGSESLAYAGGEKTTFTGGEQTEYAGSETRAHNGDDTTTESGTEKETTDSGRAQQGDTRNTGYSRNQPMSASVTASAQTATPLTVAVGSSNLSARGVDGYFNAVPNITNPTSTQDALAQSAATEKSITERETEYNDRASKAAYNSEETTSFNGRTDTKTYQDRSDTRLYQDRSDTRSFTDRKDTDIYNSVTDTQTLDRTLQSSGDDISKKQGTEKNEGQATRHEIETGRHRSPQEMLQEARAYIIGSPAWTYLRGKLEPCFYQVYDLDELVYTEED